MLETFEETLNLMAYLDAFWQSSRENGERAVPTILALGKLFEQVHRVHKGGLRKRILEVREKLQKAEHRYAKALNATSEE